MANQITVAGFVSLDNAQRIKLLAGKEVFAGQRKVISVGLTMSGRYTVITVDGSEQTQNISQDQYHLLMNSGERFEVKDHFVLEIRPCNSK